MRFTKMHGIGNDYVYVDCFAQEVWEPQRLAQVVSDRHFGIGSDGLILVMPSERADVRMRMFNADGSEAQMCGNGIRCLAKFAYENELAQGKAPTQTLCQDFLRTSYPSSQDIQEITVETLRGVLTLNLAINAGRVEQVCVDMGEPILMPGKIPVDVVGTQAVGVPLSIEGQNFLMTCVSMGNPHVVFYCPEVTDIELERLGPVIEYHRLFPQRVNVHFVQVVSSAEVIMRTWERGSGITLACGTGACAVCVAGVLASKTGRQILAHLPGGDLHLLWQQEDNHVYMAGPAQTVYSGDWPEE
ncbi:MAG: diaminopimelate epimerase [Sedimentisphaerales bacterium]|nr:diaminopimelate epimerase [Sedimentisphaerales bacterium]